MGRLLLLILEMATVLVTRENTNKIVRRHIIFICFDFMFRIGKEGLPLDQPGCSKEPHSKGFQPENGIIFLQGNELILQEKIIKSDEYNTYQHTVAECPVEFIPYKLSPCFNNHLWQE